MRLVVADELDQLHAVLPDEQERGLETRGGFGGSLLRVMVLGGCFILVVCFLLLLLVLVVVGHLLANADHLVIAALDLLGQPLRLSLGDLLVELGR